MSHKHFLAANQSHCTVSMLLRAKGFYPQKGQRSFSRHLLLNLLRKTQDILSNSKGKFTLHFSGKDVIHTCGCWTLAFWVLSHIAPLPWSPFPQAAGLPSPSRRIRNIGGFWLYLVPWHSSCFHFQFSIGRKPDCGDELMLSLVLRHWKPVCLQLNWLCILFS